MDNDIDAYRQKCLLLLAANRPTVYKPISQDSRDTASGFQFP